VEKKILNASEVFTGGKVVGGQKDNLRNESKRVKKKTLEIKKKTHNYKEDARPCAQKNFLGGSKSHLTGRIRGES